MIKSVVCFISIISFSFAIGNKGDSLVMAGVRSFYNYEFDRSIDILDKAQKSTNNISGAVFLPEDQNVNGCKMNIQNTFKLNDLKHEGSLTTIRI